jgi:predicted  nucleic acid-binding Zn-ribbon protein
MAATDARQQQLVDLQGSLEQLAKDSSSREQQLVDLQSSLERLAHDSSGREETLVALQQSVTRYTKWLLVLTIVVAVIGVGTIVIAATH